MRISPFLLLALGAVPATLGGQTFAQASDAAAAPAAKAAELPRATVATGYPAGGRSVRIGANANLQAALDAARPGDVLLLPRGATYVGNFVLRAKGAAPASAPAGGWIVIRTDVPDAALGAEGTRMTPSRSKSLDLARILSPNYDPAIGTEPSAHHIRFTGVEIGATPAAKQMNMLVRFGESGERQRTAASMPHHLVIDRSFVHGTATLDVKRCIALNSATSAVVDSWVSDCHARDGDSQAILGYNGAGPYRIQNNYLEAAHEVIMFGGSDPGVPGLVPSDIEVRGNHITRPVAWKRMWQAKNLFETKNAQRVLVEGNVLENNWSGAQTGFAFVLKSENQDNSAPWSTSSDITVRYNIIRNTGSVFNLAAAGSSNRTVPAARFTISHNLAEGVNVGPYSGDGIAFQVLGVSDAIITHNTIINPKGEQSTMVFDGPPARRLVFHSNLFNHGQYGVHGTGAGTGTGTITAYAPSAVFRTNAIIGADCRMYPPGTVCPGTYLAAGFVGALKGDYRAGPGPLKGRGFDGGDIGADIAQVEKATSGAVVAP